MEYGKAELAQYNGIDVAYIITVSPRINVHALIFEDALSFRKHVHALLFEHNKYLKKNTCTYIRT